MIKIFETQSSCTTNSCCPENEDTNVAQREGKLIWNFDQVRHRWPNAIPLYRTRVSTVPVKDIAALPFKNQRIWYTELPSGLHSRLDNNIDTPVWQQWAEYVVRIAD